MAGKIRVILADINKSITNENLYIVKVVASHALGIKQTNLDASKHLTDVYTLLESEYPVIADSLITFILTRIDVHRGLLTGLKTVVPAETEDKVPKEMLKEVDFILMVSDIFGHLTEINYSSLLMMAKNAFLHPSKDISSRTHLLQLLLEKGTPTTDLLRYLFMWLDIVGSSFLHKKLREYCNRYSIEEPQWNHLLASAKGK